MLDLRYLSTEDQQLILSIPFEDKDPEETIYYLDEWMIGICEGKIQPSIVDEAAPVKQSASGEVMAVQAKLEKVQGQADGERSNYVNYLNQKRSAEKGLSDIVRIVTTHRNDPVIDEEEPYSDDQISKLDELMSMARELKKYDREMQIARNNYYNKYDDVKVVEQELKALTLDGKAAVTVDSKTAMGEMNAVRQMIKMSVGRQGNHFPILINGFVPRETKDYLFKGNVINHIKDIERLDKSLFERTFKRVLHRIPPYIILVPGYGNYGTCWEPYNKYNKATSKGRVAMPIFCKNPRFTMTVGFADLRWQTAKELAGYHWMDEGLTGRYYEYTQDQKVKGDTKTLFIEDYILWITKESEGIQKLHKDARYVFWRFVPFPDDLKEELSKKGFYYEELFKKEGVYKMSQGG